jgi:hypothetical protein
VGADAIAGLAQSSGALHCAGRGGRTKVARIVAEKLSKIWGQQVAIENRGGAGTNIGNEMVARSDPDGYTVLFATSSLAVNRGLVPLAQLRSDCGFCAGLTCFQISVIHVCAELLAGQIGHGVRCLPKGSSG